MDIKLKLIFSKQFFSFIFLFLILLWVALARPYSNSPPIRSDGIGYHIWVYGIKHFDISFCKYKKNLEFTGSISNENTVTDRCHIKYPPGVGILQFPFTFPFLSPDLSKSDFTKNENTAVLILGSCLLIFSIVLLFKTLVNLGCSVNVSIVSLGGYIFGTGLFHYATYDSFSSHIYSTFGISLLLWLFYRTEFNSNWNFSKLLFFGFITFWLILVRNTNLIPTFFILFLVFSDKRNFNFKLIFSWLIASALSVSLQLAYNYYATGNLKISSYGEESFLSFGKYFFSVLFSYERGLFTYYPIVFLTIALASFNRKENLFFIFISLLIIYASIYGSWHSWYLGGGMGHRGFIELMPFGILLLGSTLNKISSTFFLFIILLITLCCYVTITIMLGYWANTFPFEHPTNTDFWNHILYL